MSKSDNKFYIKAIMPIGKTLVIAFFMLMPGLVSAQTRGTLTIDKDPRIDTLLALRLRVSKMPNTPVTYSPGGTAIGYRVQFFSGSNRSEAYDAQSKFNTLYPDIKTYIVYSSPNFKVRAGDFRTKPEASSLMQQLRGVFMSLFIISEKINLPKTEN